MLIEFSSEENLKDLFQCCGTHQKDLDIMALNSPFLWFRAAPGKKETFTIVPAPTLTTVNGIEQLDEENLYKELADCETVSDQIQLLHDRTMLNDLGIRLRYMVARQVIMSYFW